MCRDQNKINLFLRTLEYGQSKKLLKVSTNQNYMKIISVIIFLNHILFLL